MRLSLPEPVHNVVMWAIVGLGVIVTAPIVAGTAALTFALYGICWVKRYFVGPRQKGVWETWFAWRPTRINPDPDDWWRKDDSYWVIFERVERRYNSWGEVSYRPTSTIDPEGA